MILSKATLTALLHDSVVRVTAFSSDILIEFSEKASPELVNNIIMDAQLNTTSWGLDNKSIYVYAENKEN